MIETREQAQEALLKWKTYIRAIYAGKGAKSMEEAIWRIAFEEGLATARILGTLDEREISRGIAIRALAERGID